MDLNNFQVQLHRLNRERWNDVGLGEHIQGLQAPNLSDEQMQQIHDKALSQPCSFMARWRITYKIPS